MAHLNLMTGEWEDDVDGSAPQQAGALGDQAQAPVLPAPPPPGGLDSLPLGDLPMVPGQGAPGEAPQDTPLLPPAPGTPPAIPDLPDVKPVAPLPAPAPIPAGRVVSPAEAANLGQIDQLNAGRLATAQDQGALAGAQASAKVADADRQAAEHNQFMLERQRIADAADKQIAARTAQANADMEKYRSFGIKDPDAEQSFTTRILKALAIAGGAYAAGMNGGSNQALGIIQQATKDNIDRQKAQQEKLLRIAEKSGTDVKDATAARDDAFKQLDMKHSTLLEGAALELKKQLVRTGVPQAQIDSNEAVQKLQGDALEKREKVLQSIRNDETSLAHADIAALAKKRAAGVGGGGKPTADALATLSQYAQDNPGDQPGLYRLAATLKLKDPAKAVAGIITQSKPTESQSKDAKQSAVGLRAVEAIEKSGYTPNDADIQKWLNNQRSVGIANKLGESGGLGALAAGAGQKFGVLKQSEIDGLDPKAAEYFGNVRRFMETIGRAQSGAAISPTEWQDFFNQYGPKSPGGLGAARQYLEDQSRAAGAASRQLGSGKPKSDAPKSSEADRAKTLLADPRSKNLSPGKRAYLLKLSRGEL